MKARVMSEADYEAHQAKIGKHMAESVAKRMTGTLIPLHEVYFDWPVPALSPNARLHWSVKARAAKQYRLHCYMLAKNAKLEKRVNLHIVFMPPDNRKYDLDNLIARMKSGLDGLADALGVNDNQFKIQAVMSATLRTGKVRVRVT